MGIVTTHSEGRVVTHESDAHDAVEVVQLPARDAAAHAAAPAPAPKAAKPTAAVKAAVTQQRARTAKAAKSKVTKK